MTEAEQVFREQVAAFNARDIERFVATYAADCVVTAITAEPLRGAAALREHYSVRFTDPALHCDVLTCAVMAERWVCAHELVGSSKAVVEVAAIFEISDQLIHRVASLRSARTD